jgi:hypothetical protein
VQSLRCAAEYGGRESCEAIIMGAGRKLAIRENCLLL